MKADISVPSSKSDEEAEQVNNVPVVTPLLGEIATLLKDGALFATVTEVDVLDTDAPLLSVVVAVQMIVSPGEN